MSGSSDAAREDPENMPKHTWDGARSEPSVREHMATSSGRAESKRWAAANDARSCATLSGIWPDFGHRPNSGRKPDKGQRHTGGFARFPPLSRPFSHFTCETDGEARLGQAAQV